MPRRVEDIKRGDHRSIRDISFEKEKAEAARPKTKTEIAAEAREEKGDKIPIHRIKKVTPPAEPVKRQRRSSGKSYKWAWVVGGIVLVTAIAGYVASVYFSRATFTIVPVVQAVNVDTTIIAVSTSSPNYLRYTIDKFSDTAYADVAAASGPYTSTKASGKITVYNAYSTASQQLIAGTRIANDSGLVYRLTGSVVVPGYVVSKGVTIPGKVSATIIADQPGANYNISTANPVSDFRVISYKGTTKYSAFYGRLSTDVVGGFVGVKKIISPTVLASTTATLQTNLIAELLVKAKTAVPEGYITYDTAYDTSFSAPIETGTASDTATVSVTGTLYSLTFKKADLVAKLAGADKVAAFGGFAYTTPGLDSLSFTIAKPSSFSAPKANTLIAHLKGSMSMVGSIPVSDIKAKLAGLSLPETRPVLESYSPIIDITKSSGEIFPSWANSVPEDQNRITVSVQGQ